MPGPNLSETSVYPIWLRHPYVILAPAYRRTSAGVRALHLLCHCLNHRGARAFVTTGDVNPDLDTPTASRNVFAEWHRKRVTPIVIYPETVSGNPLGSECVVRYLLNFPGHLGGDRHAHPGDFYVSFARGMNPWVRREEEQVLHMPLVDTRVFRPPTTEVKRSGSCYYAAKYKSVHKGKTFPITANSIEITRGQEDSQTPETIADIFRRSEFFYAYENTALALEALLCGCPVILLPNPYFTEAIAKEELGTDGIAWGTDEREVARALATTGRMVENYARTVEAFWTQLDHFIERTQALAAGRTQREGLTYGYIDETTVPWPDQFTARSFLRAYVIFKSVMEKGRLEKLAALRAHVKGHGLRHGIRKWTRSLYGSRYQGTLFRWLGIATAEERGTLKVDRGPLRHEALDIPLELPPRP